jgi:ubiquinone/menaquinone biosynthesis C-methylase UbiE
VGNKIGVISSDESFLADVQERLGAGYSVLSKLISIQSVPILKRDILSILEEFLGLTSGDISVQAVIMDASFPSSGASDYVITEVLDEILPGKSGSAGGLLLGAGIPVFVNFNAGTTDALWKTAASGVFLYASESIREDLQTALSHSRYNLSTLEVENEFAQIYDEKELSGAATVSAILWENEFVLSQIREYVRQHPFPIRVLDLGCGTGRFEEVLLSDPGIASKIDRIYAVDFAPMYLKKARDRLKHFLTQEDLNRVTFSRRIAEDSHFPSNYFDVVIAGFGIICFSQFYKTIPEIQRILKPSGLVIFNGYNRNAATYDFDAAMKLRTGKSASHFAIEIDRKKHEMYLHDKVIQCFTFQVSDLEGLLQIAGLRPIYGASQTFPLLYGCARKNYLNKLSSNQGSHVGCLHEAQTCLNQGECNGYASYQSVNLEKDQYASGFDITLHRMDGDLIDVLKNQGFYFAVAAHK